MSSNRRPIRLGDLLARLYHYLRKEEVAFQQEVDRRAALVAKHAVCLGEAQGRLLDLVHRGELDVGDLTHLASLAKQRGCAITGSKRIVDLGDRGGLTIEDLPYAEATRAVLVSSCGKAEAQLRKELAVPQGVAYFQQTVWEYAVQAVRRAVSVPLDEDHLRDYCGLVNLDAETNGLTTEFARLDSAGFTEGLLSGIWEQYPKKATEMELPKSTYGEDSEGRHANEVTLSEAAEKWDVSKSVWSKAARKKFDEPGYLPTRKVGRNRYVKRDHAKKFAENYLARREQRIVGSGSSEGASVVATLMKIKKRGQH